MEPIKIAVEALQSKQRKCKAARAANMAVYAIAVVLFLIQRLRPAALVLMALGLLLHFLVVRRMTAAYKAEAAQASLRFGLCGRFADFSYAVKGGMSYDNFRDWKLAPIREEPRSLLCRNGFTAKDSGLVLAGQEATFHYNAPNPQGKDSIHFLSGTLLSAGTPGNKGWLFLRSDVLNEAAAEDFLQRQGYAPAPNTLEGWALYGQPGAPDLSEDVLRRAERLERSVSILRLTDQGAAAFLNGHFYVSSQYLLVRPTEQLLQENTLAERDNLLTLFYQWLR